MSSITKAHDEGRQEEFAEDLEKGKEVFIAKGEHEKAMFCDSSKKTARNLISMGLSVEQISKATGL